MDHVARHPEDRTAVELIEHTRAIAFTAAVEQAIRKGREDGMYLDAIQYQPVGTPDGVLYTAMLVWVLPISL